MPSKVVPGINDISTTNPDLAAEWHPTKNKPLEPSETRAGTAKKIWWLCKADSRHEWQATGDSRLGKGTGCPICANQVVVEGINDLSTVYPEIAREWFTQKNVGKTTKTTSSASPKAYWWKCSIDSRHAWKASVYSRTKTGTGCPYCDGKKTLAGQNDLASTHPELAAEWHPSKNGELKATEVVAGTNKSIWWLCREDSAHEWSASGGARLRGRGCPFCSSQSLLTGFNDMATTHPDLAAEWHPTKNAELTPAQVFASTGRNLWWRCSADYSHEWQAKGGNRVTGSGCPVCSNRVALRGQNDLETTAPNLASQWDHERNGSLKPSDLVAGSHKSVWWLCDVNPRHSWQATVGHRTRTGCPICSNRKVLTGENDLESTNPALAKQWHKTKNGSLLPSALTRGSAKKIWWTCPKDERHEWHASIATRETNGCPFCSNKSVLSGYNDLLTTDPLLASQWDYSKNGTLLPKNVSSGSSKSVWWRCSKHDDHVWQATISSRKGGRIGCPVCANLQVLPGFNDFETTNPGLASEWHVSKNAPLRPSEVVAGTQRVVWWQCLNNPEHTWRAGVKNRMAGTGCPSCANFGYQSTSPGLLYFIENESLHARKVGITNPKARANRLARFEVSGWKTLQTWSDDDGLLILNLETRMLKWLRKDLGLPPFLSAQDMGRQGGWSETFSIDGITNREVIEKVQYELAQLHTLNGID